MKFLLLVALSCFTIFGLIFGIGAWIGGFFAKRKKLRQMQIALDKARKDQDNSWNEAEKVKDLVMLYANMVAKHGPESNEAQAFRFGTGNQLIKRLHGDDAGMSAFEREAGIIDETYRLIKKS